MKNNEKNILDKSFIKCIKIGRQFRNKPVFTTDGKCFICFFGDVILGYDVDTFFARFVFKESNERVSCVSLIPESNNLIISGTKEGTISIWDINSNQNIKRYKIKRKIYQILPTKASEAFIILTGKLTRNEIFEKRNHSKAKKLAYTVSSVHLPITSNEKPLHFTKFARVAYCAPNYIAYSYDQNLLISLYNESFTFYNMNDGHITSRCVKSILSLSCVAIHPSKLICATGCTNGKILLWNLLHEPLVPYTKLHWHSTSILDICFSCDGNYLYSGGKENVFVCWTIETREKAFIPRLESSIKNIISSESHICLIHINNEITFIDSHNLNIIKKITDFQRNTNPYISLKYDNESHCLVFGPKTGSISFFSPSYNKNVHVMQVVHQNFIGRNEWHILYQYEVTNICFSKSKKYMYTVEESVKNEFIRLKTWYYSEKIESYKLSNTIESPHLAKVNDLISFCFDFTKKYDYVVTSSNDGFIKIWKTYSESLVSSYEKKRYALEYHSCYYYSNKYKPSLLQFSYDASIIAVSYENFVVVFNFPSLNLRYVLPFDSPKYLLFGNEMSPTYMTIASETYIIVYDLLSMTPIWSKTKRILSLLPDPYSSYFCLIAQSNTATMDILIYSFSSSTPIQILRDVSPYQQTIISAVFGQPLKQVYDNFHLHGCLYFMVESHDIYALTPEHIQEADVRQNDAIVDSVHTSVNIAVDTTTQPSPAVQVESLANVLPLNLEKEFYQRITSTPSHLLPNPTILSSQYLNVVLSRYKASANVASVYNDDATSIATFPSTSTIVPTSFSNGKDNSTQISKQSSIIPPIKYIESDYDNIDFDGITYNFKINKKSINTI